MRWRRHRTVIYADGQSSYSLNAQIALGEGKGSASRIAAQFGLTAAQIRANVESCEWHHVSKFANEVDFYDPHDVLAAILATPSLRRLFRRDSRSAKRRAWRERLIETARENLAYHRELLARKRAIRERGYDPNAARRSIEADLREINRLLDVLKETTKRSNEILAAYAAGKVENKTAMFVPDRRLVSKNCVRDWANARNSLLARAAADRRTAGLSAPKEGQEFHHLALQISDLFKPHAPCVVALPSPCPQPPQGAWERD